MTILAVTQRIFISLFLLALGLFSMGTVVKKKDPILETQTGPVGYSEKMKEEAGGKKGPPAPTLELYPKERFLVEGPMEKSKSSMAMKEEVEAELWLGEDDVWEGWEGEEEFKPGEKRDDTRKKSDSERPRFLDMRRG